MTYRDRREAKAARLREYAAKREARAAEVFKASEQYRGDYAFNTQPGHIPERARLVAREDRAHESLAKARNMASRAGGIDDQLDQSIYSDDPDAIEQLRERIAELTTRQERMKEINKLVKAALKDDGDTGTRYEIIIGDLGVTEREHADLMSVYRTQGHEGYPSYALSNNRSNIRRNEERLRELENPAPKPPRMIYTRYASRCAGCNAELPTGTQAVYDKAARTVTGWECCGKKGAA